jgi:hypothetical protein
MPNTQEKLSDLDCMTAMLLSARGEIARLRTQVGELEMAAFQAQLQARYANPGETIRIEADGTILRMPPGFGQPLASVPEESAGP